MSTQPIASLSLDLDNKWSYLKTHGDASWESYPSYLEYVVPRFLSLLDERDLKITVFIVGLDAERPEHARVLRSIAEHGHEIGNHSYRHEPWLHLYRPEQLDQELAAAEQAIVNATGQKPIGFRGPGFSLTDQVLRALVRRGYQYDGSTFPTYLGPAARAYYFMKSTLSKAERAERKELFGKFRDGFQTNHPFFWQVDEERLLEIPVSTMPLFKVPFHASYLMYLSSFSPSLAKAYFWQSLTLCRVAGVNPSFLLHPLDFLGREDEPELGFFPGMNLDTDFKLNLMRHFLGSLDRRFRVVPMREHARIAAAKKLAQRPIQLARMGAV